MTLQKGDFIELEFTGRIVETGEIFDTNIKEKAKEAKMNINETKPFILSIGNKMLPPGLDKDLEGKEEGKEYNVTIQPEEAFGNRDAKLVQMVPTKLFHEQKIAPQKGMQLSLEGRLVKILSSDRGRTLVDFNGPLAGKKVNYTYKITKKITEEKEKINALQDFLFRKRFEFETEKEKITFQIQEKEKPYIELFKQKMEEILNKKIETKIKETKKEEQKTNPKHEEKEHIHGPNCKH